MTDRGLPIVNGAPACPFVAFEDDRDGRALAPDHRHRCFAESKPAPRALAHQEAYCLASAFPVCPTFQDWARREAAAARSGSADSSPPREDIPAVTPVSTPLPPRDREPRSSPGTEVPPPLPPRRNPQRDWAAPPPWSADEPERDPGGDPSHYAPPAAAPAAAAAGAAAWGADSRGLAGSAADRLAGPDPDKPAASGQSGYAPLPPDVLDDAPGVADVHLDADPDELGTPRRASRRAPAPGRREQVSRPPAQDPSEMFGPAWEKPQRYEAYPSLRTRVGLPSFGGGISRLGVAVLALVFAAVGLFFVGPMLLGIGNDGGGGAAATPRATVAAATPSAAPTLAPAPTPQVYVVAKGDTMSKIAKKFGVTVEEILAANPQVQNANKIDIGDELTIPAPTSEGVPDAGEESAAP
ncbi:MAG: LysM peptidoglycan-binding domain-containing protein [Chloroflexi bacterium]|nr:LysM peptidoglycan-binding domain-containing protein [Chloroflexota bacterium]